jgi:hypothetical protein
MKKWRIKLNRVLRINTNKKSKIIQFSNNYNRQKLVDYLKAHIIFN